MSNEEKDFFRKWKEVTKKSELIHKFTDVEFAEKIPNSWSVAEIFSL
jgi:hypothetical protein